MFKVNRNEFLSSKLLTFGIRSEVQIFIDECNLSSRYHYFMGGRVLEKERWKTFRESSNNLLIKIDILYHLVRLNIYLAND